MGLTSDSAGIGAATLAQPPVIQPGGPAILTPAGPLSLSIGQSIIYRDAAFQQNGGAGPSVIMPTPLVVRGGTFSTLGIGQGLRIKVYGQTANNANAKTVRLSAGANFDLPLTINVVDLWCIEVLMQWRDATNCHVWAEGKHGVSAGAMATVLLGPVGSFAIDPTQDQLIQLFAQVATAAADIAKRGIVVEIIP